MNGEQTELHRSIREDYRVLLYADAVLPIFGNDRMDRLYQSAAGRFFAWAEEEGERLRADYLALATVREKSRFPTVRVRLECRITWEDDSLCSVLLRVTRPDGTGEKTGYLSGMVWNRAENTVLPLWQILAGFGGRKLLKRTGFVPDGAFLENGTPVLYRNPRTGQPMRIAKFPFA